YKREKFAFMAPPAHTDASKRKQVDELIAEFLNPSTINDAGICSAARVQSFLEGYRKDTHPTSLVRKDTLLNHLLTLHILHKQFSPKLS
ncbi:MAG: asparagine synthetase B, partial [Luteolibacter sp.]